MERCYASFSIISFQQIAGTPPIGLLKQSCAGLDLDPGNPRISGQLWACLHSRYLDSSCVDCPPSDRREEAPRRSCRDSSFQGQNAGALRIGETGQNKKCSGGRNSLPSLIHAAKGNVLSVRYKCNRNQNKLRTKGRVPNTYQITAYR